MSGADSVDALALAGGDDGLCGSSSWRASASSSEMAVGEGRNLEIGLVGAACARAEGVAFG